MQSSISLGFYRIKYILVLNYASLIITIKLRVKGAGDVYEYINLPDSPFTPTLHAAPVDIYDEYFDLDPAGISLQLTSIIMTNLLPDIIAGTEFAITITPQNAQNAVFFYPELGTYFLMILLPTTPEICLPSSPNTPTSPALLPQIFSPQFCGLFSASKADCNSHSFCTWIHLEDTHSSWASCSPKLCQPTSQYSLPLSYKMEVDANYYYLKSTPKKSGVYTASIEILTAGGLWVDIYKNPDYTGILLSKRILYLQMRLNKELNPYFDYAQHYSIRVKGAFRSFHSEPFTFILTTQLYVKIYVNFVLLAEKSALGLGTLVFTQDIHKYQIYFLLIEGYYPHSLGLSETMLNLEWESPNQKREIIRPICFFHIHPLLLSPLTLNVLPSLAHPQGSLLTPTTSTTLKSGELFMVHALVFDIYGNKRGVGYTDTVTGAIYRAGTEIGRIEGTKGAEGQYSISYMSSVTGSLTLKLEVNNHETGQTIEFSVTPGAISPMDSPTHIYIKSHQPSSKLESSCSQSLIPIYIEFSLRDAAGNQIPPVEELISEIDIKLEGPGGAEIIYYVCELSAPHILCQVTPQLVGAHTLSARRMGENFQGSPASVEVLRGEVSREYSVRTYTGGVAGGEVGILNIYIDMVLKDSTGELVTSSAPICTEIPHQKFEFQAVSEYIYTEGMRGEVVPGSEIRYISTYTPMTGEYSLTGTFSPGPGPLSLLHSLHLLLYIFPARTSTGGLAVEYFSNNNLISPPFERGILPQIWVSRTTAPPWADLHAKHKAFSLRLSGMLKPLYSEVYTFHVSMVYGCRFYVAGGLVIDTDLSVVQGDYQFTGGMLYAVTLEFRQVEVSVYAGIEPLLQLMWDSPSQGIQVVPSHLFFLGDNKLLFYEVYYPIP